MRRMFASGLSKANSPARDTFVAGLGWGMGVVIGGEALVGEFAELDQANARILYIRPQRSLSGCGSLRYPLHRGGAASIRPIHRGGCSRQATTEPPWMWGPRYPLHRGGAASIRPIHGGGCSRQATTEPPWILGASGVNPFQ